MANMELWQRARNLLMAAGTVVWIGAVAGWPGADRLGLIVVADTRVLDNPMLKYIAETYNTHELLFAVWNVVLTAACGFVLGFALDGCMWLMGVDFLGRRNAELRS